MKKTIFALVVLCMSLKTYSNGVNPKTILVSNKWKLDVENTIGLNTKDKEEKKSKAIKKVVQDLNFTFEFFKNDKMTIQMLDAVIYNGNYKLEKRKDNLLFIQNINKEEFSYQVVSINKDKIILRPLNEEVNLILIPAIDKDYETILISKEWKIDNESIEKMLLKSQSNPQFIAMSDEDKEATLTSIELSLKGVQFIFMKDFQFRYKIVALGSELLNSSGTFAINKEKNEIVTNIEIEPNQVYKIISIDENKIHLHHIQRDFDYILVPLKN